MTPTELIDVSNRLITERIDWENVWANCARLVLPMQDRHWNKGASPSVSSREAIETLAPGPKSVDRLAERFDITGLVAADRLATGMLSLVTPDSEKWMDLGIADPLGAYEASDEETRWLERQRDYLFSTRYNPLTGFTLANKYAMRGSVVFGTGLYLIEEAYGRRGQNDAAVPFTYAPLPLSENYLTVDAQGMLDNNYRRYRLTCRQAAKLFGADVSTVTMTKANDPKRWDQPVEILHWVGYRHEKGYRADPMRNSVVESVYIEVENKHEIRRGGFSYWPIISYVWNQVPGSPYGESPVMLVLSEIKSGNVLSKNALLAAQQLTSPPLATMDDATMARPNMNPRAINYGALDAQGRLKIQPIITAQNPSLVESILEASRNQIKEGLYTNLWQILISNPQMTATEALIRANEKAELLGPIGTNFQHGLSRCTDAELTILEGKGAWRPGAVLEPPPSLAGRNLRPSFKGPLDRLRRSGEAIGIARTFEGAAPLFEADPSLLDKIDGDAVLEILQEVNGAPKRMFRTDDQVAEIRAQREQAQQAMQTAELAKTAGEAASKGLPAIQQLSQLAPAQ
jgi:hypothetical protein